MYITDPVVLRAEIDRRRTMRSEIQTNVDAFINLRYRLPNFTATKERMFAASLADHDGTFDPEASYGILARQVSGTSIEDVACHLLAAHLGLVPCSYVFTRDNFHSRSNDKLYRIKVPFYSWSRKGNRVIEYRNALGRENGHTRYVDFDMMRFDRIEVEGRHLAACHRDMQEQVFTGLQHVYADISDFWGEVLAEVAGNGQQPSMVWKDRGDGRDVSADVYAEEEARALVVRPASKWYYLMYMSLFLDGSMVLLETYDNETGGVPEARALFEGVMSIICREVGFCPLVVKTWPLNRDMLCVNRHVLNDGPVAVQRLCSIALPTSNTVDMTRRLTTFVTDYGKP